MSERTRKGKVDQRVSSGDAAAGTCYVGGYGGFDRVAAAAVKRLKQKHPEITLMIVLPYHLAERPTEVSEGFDGTYYPEGLESTPKRYAIVRANRIMVDSCDWLICYVRHGTGF